MKSILAIDIGTHCGIAYNSSSFFMCETITLATSKELKAQKLERHDRRNDCRVHCLFSYLTGLHNKHHFDIVVVEDVQFASYVLAVQLWASLRAAVWLAFPPSSGVILEFVPVGTLKKFATGNGAATKEMMAEALKRGHPEEWDEKLDDNQIDAIWLWNWANTHLTRSPKSGKVSV